MIKENERLIKANGFSLEKFGKLSYDEQVRYIEYWKDMTKKEKYHQKFDNYEQASLKLLGDYLKESEDYKRVKDYKAQLSEEIEKKRMSNLAVPTGTNLQSLTRMEWNRQRVMYFFKKKEDEEQENKEDTGDIFNLRIKRRVITRKEKEKRLNDQRRMYNERFDKGANFDSENGDLSFEEDEQVQRQEAQPVPQRPLPKPQPSIFDYDPNAKDMDDLIKEGSSDDSLFKANKSASSSVERRRNSNQTNNNMPAESLSYTMYPVSKDDDFDKFLKDELKKIDRQGGELEAASRQDSRFVEGDEVKPILEDDRVKNRKYIPKGYFERKMKPRMRKGNRQYEGDAESEDEEEAKFDKEAIKKAREYEAQNMRMPGQDWQTQKTAMEKLFDEPLDERTRRSRDTASQLMLSLGEEDLGSNRVVFDWLNKEDVDIGDLNFNFDENSINNSESQTMVPESRPANILEFFSGGFFRDDQGQSNEQVNRGDARIHALRREFIEPKVPAARNEGDHLGALKKMLEAFGIPWIQSPTEAEAQCAQLEAEGLVDGTVSEDCDSFLFGSRRVFRGLFGSARRPEEYKQETIELELGLDREQLVMMALFLGCDYCIGIRGVGIVNAIEIVDAYSSVEALSRFKHWAEKPDYWLDREVYERSKESYPKEYLYMQKHKNYKKEWELPQDFPNLKVIDAFFNPQVSKNLSDVIQTSGLRVDSVVNYARKVFKLDENYVKMIEVPLKREFSKRQNPQIKEFFRPIQNKVEINSTRLKTSIANLRTVRLDQSVSDMLSRASAEDSRLVSRLSREGLISQTSPSANALASNPLPKKMKMQRTSSEERAEDEAELKKIMPKRK